jgi:hypothetical protein
MISGTIEDQIPERVIATGTCVAVLDTPRFPPRTRDFLARTFVPVGAVRVVGQILGRVDPGASALVAFDIAVPAWYAIVGERGGVAGLLDGRPYAGPRRLAAGRHEFRPAPQATPAGRIAVLWARAARKGYSPFAAPPPAET